MDFSPDDIEKLKTRPNLYHCGWLSPEGVWYFCTTYQHDFVARGIARDLYGWTPPWERSKENGEPIDAIDYYNHDACTLLSKKGWLRCRGRDRRPGYAVEGDLRPVTHAQRRELADAGYDLEGEGL